MKGAGKSRWRPRAYPERSHKEGGVGCVGWVAGYLPKQDSPGEVFLPALLDCILLSPTNLKLPSTAEPEVGRPEAVQLL